jgi:hypothetical protein
MGVADLLFCVGSSPSGKEYRLAISTNSNLPCVHGQLSKGKPDIGRVFGERRGKGSGDGWWLALLSPIALLSPGCWLSRRIVAPSLLHHGPIGGGGVGRHLKLVAVIINSNFSTGSLC